MALLITGGIGTLGRPTVEALRAAGVEPRILSRRLGDAHVVADLQSGVGLREALDGVDTVLHLATNRRSDARATQHLVDAARSAGVQHLVYLSIVGVDTVPFGYYRAKLAYEELVAGSGVPFTILRATQFHDFVAGFFRAQRLLPRVNALDTPFQPISTAAVADRLVSLAAAEPVNERVDDLGGPEVLPMAELAQQWLVAHGASAEAAPRRVVEWRAPGTLVAAYRAGLHTTGVPGPGIRFADWAATTRRRTFQHPVRLHNSGDGAARSRVAALSRRVDGRAVSPTPELWRSGRRDAAAARHRAAAERRPH